MLEDGNYIVDWNILMSLSMCDFCNSVSFSQHHWTSVMLSCGRRIEQTGVYGCPNCPNCIRIRSLKHVCLFWGLCKSGLYHAKIYGTEGARNVTNTAQNHQLDLFEEFATTENTSNVLGQRSSQCFETLLQWCVYFCYFPSSSDLLFNQWLSIWRLDC